MNMHLTRHYESLVIGFFAFVFVGVMGCSKSESSEDKPIAGQAEESQAPKQKIVPKPENATLTAPRKLVGTYINKSVKGKANERDYTLTIAATSIATNDIYCDLNISWDWIAPDGENQWIFGLEKPVPIDNRKKNSVSGGTITLGTNGSVTIGLINNGDAGCHGDAMINTFQKQRIMGDGDMIPLSDSDHVPASNAKFPKELQGIWKAKKVKSGCTKVTMVIASKSVVITGKGRRFKGDGGWGRKNCDAKGELQKISVDGPIMKVGMRSAPDARGFPAGRFRGDVSIMLSDKEFKLVGSEWAGDYKRK